MASLSAWLVGDVLVLMLLMWYLFLVVGSLCFSVMAHGVFWGWNAFAKVGMSFSLCVPKRLELALLLYYTIQESFCISEVLTLEELCLSVVLWRRGGLKHLVPNLDSRGGGRRQEQSGPLWLLGVTAEWVQRGMHPCGQRVPLPSP